MTDALVPALVQTFAIIFLGYGCGLLRVLSPEQASGVGKFVATVSLPGLLFRSMVKLDLHAVDWRFVLCIFVSKTIVFIVTAVGTHLYERRCAKRIAFAGINAIFCTQSNDLAFGLPIVAALFSAEHPEYPAYLFVVAPISLMILNPIAFAMMAYGSSTARVADELAFPKLGPPLSAGSSSGSGSGGGPSPANVAPADAQSIDQRSLSMPASPTPGTLAFWGAVLWRVLFNPVVSLVILGLLCNLALSSHLPLVVDQALAPIGAAFTATALFSLGYSMVGKMSTLSEIGITYPVVLVVCKTLLLSAVCKLVMDVLGAPPDLASYAFLYGLFPTAPSVFLFATQFEARPELVAPAMVMCTFFSAPLMFISSRVLAITAADHTLVGAYVANASLFASSLTIPGALWIVAAFLGTRRWRRLPHMIVWCISLSLLVSAGADLACLAAPASLPSFANPAVLVSVRLYGTFAARAWQVGLAVHEALFFLASPSHAARAFVPLHAVCWTLPALILGGLLLGHGVQLADPDAAHACPSVQGPSGIALTAGFLAAIFIVITVCLVLIRRALLERARQSSAHPTASALCAEEAPPPEPPARADGPRVAAPTRSASANHSATPLLRDFGGHAPAPAPTPWPANEPSTPETVDYDNLLALPRGWQNGHERRWQSVASGDASPRWAPGSSEELPVPGTRARDGGPDSAASLARRRWRSGAGRLRRGDLVDDSGDEASGKAGDGDGGGWAGEDDEEAATHAARSARSARRAPAGSRFSHGTALGAAPSTALFGDVRFSPLLESGDKWAALERSSRISVGEVRNRRSLSRRRLYLVYTAFSSGLGFAVCFAIAYFRDMSAPVAELVFLDTCLSKGEGLVLCLIFGFDPGVKAWFGRLWSKLYRLFTPSSA